LNPMSDEPKIDHRTPEHMEKMRAAKAAYAAMKPKRKPKPRGTPGAARKSRPTYNQAQKIIDRFGGKLAEVAKMLELSRGTVYRWIWAKPEGTDGLIPQQAIDLIKRKARYLGVILTPKDWEPERIIYEEPQK
jgi:DNA invertase Pin-like site-specific DNA recombinase